MCLDAVRSILYSTERLIKEEVEYVSFDEQELDRAFMALADPTRRHIIARLSRGSATVNELAEPFEMTLQAISKHIQILEQAGLVTRTRDAQRRPVHLNPILLAELTGWIDQYRLIAERKFDRLDSILTSRSAPSGSSTKRSNHA